MQPLPDLGLGVEHHQLPLISKDIAHPADLRAHATQLFFNVLVATIHVVHPVEDRLAICDQGREHQRGRGAQI